MTDDHDRCEWVNVSSGTGLLRLPGQNPERCKIIVCVSVCVYRMVQLPVILSEAEDLLLF